MRPSHSIAVAPLVLLLAGCAGGEHYAPDAAQALEQSVATVAQSASTADYAGALQHLGELEQANDAALQAGRITAARHDAIARSVATVRSDLTQLQSDARQAALQQQLQQLQQQLQQDQQDPPGPDRGPRHDHGKGDG